MGCDNYNRKIDTESDRNKSVTGDREEMRDMYTRERRDKEDERGERERKRRGRKTDREDTRVRETIETVQALADEMQRCSRNRLLKARLPPAISVNQTALLTAAFLGNNFRILVRHLARVGDPHALRLKNNSNSKQLLP